LSGPCSTPRSFGSTIEIQDSATFSQIRVIQANERTRWTRFFR
jgi:hypothetical protein